jgi:hypothetical protein
VSTSGNNIPQNAVQRGIDSNGTPLFVAKAKNSKDGQWFSLLERDYLDREKFGDILVPRVNLQLRTYKQH